MGVDRSEVAKRIIVFGHGDGRMHLLRFTSVHIMRILCLVAILCCASASADANPADFWPTSEARFSKPPAVSVGVTNSNKSENIGVPSLNDLPSNEMTRGQESTAASAVMDVRQTALAAKWVELQSRIRLEQETLAGCRSGDTRCPE